MDEEIVEEGIVVMQEPETPHEITSEEREKLEKESE